MFNGIIFYLNINYFIGKKSLAMKNKKKNTFYSSLFQAFTFFLILSFKPKFLNLAFSFKVSFAKVSKISIKSFCVI